LQLRGVTALPGVRRYLAAAGQAGLARATISASANTLPMLELATLSSLVEARVDADVIRAERIRTPPAPDLLLAACRFLDVPPERAVSFTHNPAGVAAGLSAGVTVIGVGEGADEELLRGYGADRVVRSLHALLGPRIGGDASGDGRR
jgi:beta-phosphoglucomutase-like phosphatase (HAD superfamily)